MLLPNKHCNIYTSGLSTSNNKEAIKKGITHVTQTNLVDPFSLQLKENGIFWVIQPIHRSSYDSTQQFHGFILIYVLYGQCYMYVQKSTCKNN